MNEVEILTKLSHPNLVTLHGCTSRHCRELLLVYEYIPNGAVADHLYVLTVQITQLDNQNEDCSRSSRGTVISPRF